MEPTNVQSPLALRLRDAAKILGISPRTLWNWNQAGIIPCARIGTGKRKIVLYSVADLQKWLAQQSKSANGGAV
jgi:predicted site-specific integrase-resolvase